MRLPFRPTCFSHRPLLSQLPRVLRKKFATAAVCSRDHNSKPPTGNIPASIPTTIAKVPKLLISPGSKHHNSLRSFLEYAEKRGLAPTKTVYVGTHYEYVVALSLLRLGFSLLRTGRKSDAGIDLIGHWVLPGLPEPLPVIVQCKVRNRCLGPEHVRELEGAFSSVPPKWRDKDVLGLLATTWHPTRGMITTIAKHSRPLGFVKVSRTGIIEQFIWNRAAIEKGLEGFSVTYRHKPLALLSKEEVEEQGGEGMGWEIPKKKVGRIEGEKRKSTETGAGGTRRDIQLTRFGVPFSADRVGLDEETVRLMGMIEEGVRTEGSKPKRGTPVTTKKVVGKPSKSASNKSKTVRATASRTATVTAKKPGRPPKVAVPAPTKRGRPPGSKNKTVKETAKK